MTALAKISALEKAANGDVLTSVEEDTLRQCADDYRPLIRLGNGFRISKAQIREAFEIIFDDVGFMTGERRKRAIRLLKVAGARGFDKHSLPIPERHPTDEYMADRMTIEVTEEELQEAS